MTRTSPRRRAGIVVAAALLAAACASGRPSNRFIRGAESGTVELLEAARSTPPAASAAAIDAAVRKARAARNSTHASLPTVEGTDRELAEALKQLDERPGALAHVRVGQAYARLGVLDFAIDHFDRAIRLDSHSAAAFDGRARVWRDWRLLALALGDARRAAHYAPDSPVTQNTLGTVLMALGECAAARSAFERARALDPAAAYAAANVETLDRMSGTPACRDHEGTAAGGAAVPAAEPLPGRPGAR